MIEAKVLELAFEVVYLDVVVDGSEHLSTSAVNEALGYGDGLFGKC